MRKNLNKLFVSALLLFSVSASAQTYLITTVAGTGVGGFGPDGGPATTSKLSGPQAVATDDSGNFYIADKINNRVRKVSKTGVITTIAGGATAGYTGDNAAATAATLNGPTSVAKDRSGNIYIADYGNSVIRKISGGIITTFAGPGVSTTLGDGGPATSAYLLNPVSVAVDKNGNVFIADQGDARVRKVDPSGVISTYAGTAIAGYNSDGIPAATAELNIPSAVCVDTFGNVFIVDENNYRIRKVSVSTGMISTVAGTGVAGYTNGVATGAKISYAYGVAVDRTGNIFISDNQEVRKIDATTGVIAIYAGMYDTSSFGGDHGLADTSKLNNPQGLAVDTAGSLYIADEANNRIRKVYKKSTVGVAQIGGQNSNINVFPNPNSGMFTIKGSLGSTNDDNVTISVMNLSGQIIYKNNVAVHNGAINTSVKLAGDLPAGYYLLHLESATQNEIARFVIQK